MATPTGNGPEGEDRRKAGADMPTGAMSYELLARLTRGELPGHPTPPEPELPAWGNLDPVDHGAATGRAPFDQLDGRPSSPGEPTGRAGTSGAPTGRAGTSGAPTGRPGTSGTPGGAAALAGVGVAAAGGAGTHTPTAGLAAPSPPTPGPESKPKRRVRTALRYRVLPRTVLGVSSLILAFAIGAGFSGVVLYSYYQYRLDQTNSRVNSLITGYKADFAKAEGDLSSASAADQAAIAQQLKAAQQNTVSPAVLATLVKEVAPSVFFVHTLDANGQPSVGTAFVVSSSASQSLLVTSYTAVEAATRSPAPTVYVQQGSTQTAVTVRTWDPTYDLALIVLPKGNLPSLTAAATTPAPEPGDHLYAVSGLGSAGASIIQASVVDVSTSGLSVDASIAADFQGGPIINQSGQVVAVASRTYSPLGFSSQGVWYTPYVEAACNQILSCPGGTLVGSH